MSVPPLVPLIAPISLRDCYTMAEKETLTEKEEGLKYRQELYTKLRTKIGEGAWVRERVMDAMRKERQSAVIFELVAETRLVDLHRFFITMMGNQPSLYCVILALFANPDEVILLVENDINIGVVHSIKVSVVWRLGLPLGYSAKPAVVESGVSESTSASEPSVGDYC